MTRWLPATAGDRIRWGTVAALAIVVLAIPPVANWYEDFTLGDFSSKFVIYLASSAVVLALWAMSYNLMLGYTGMVSFAHAAYFGVGGVDAAPAPAAGVARILARTHLGMAAAERGDLLLKIDRRDSPILSAAGGANVDGTGRNRSRVELVSYGRPVHRGYGAQAHYQQQRVQSGSHRIVAFEELPDDSCSIMDFIVCLRSAL